MNSNNEPKLLIPQEEDQQLRMEAETPAEAFFQDPFTSLILDLQHLQTDTDILFREHDCHLSPEDSCEACEKLTEINSHISSIKKLINTL